MPDGTTQKRPRGRPRGTGSDSSGGTVQALDRGLQLLTALAQDDEQSLSDLSLRAGLPASTAHRLLMTLQKHGFVAFDEATQDWSIGLEAFRTGAAFLRRANVITASQDAMRQLRDETGETANLAVPEGPDVVFVSQAESHNPIRAFFRPGTRTPMYASGIGKALLSTMPRKTAEGLLRRSGLSSFTPHTKSTPDALFADLAEIAERGWSVDDEERYLGMRCVAAPIFGPDGQAVGGLSVSGPTQRFTRSGVAETGPLVRRLAGEISARMGATV